MMIKKLTLIILSFGLMPDLSSSGVWSLDILSSRKEFGGVKPEADFSTDSSGNVQKKIITHSRKKICFCNLDDADDNLALNLIP